LAQQSAATHLVTETAAHTTTLKVQGGQSATLPLTFGGVAAGASVQATCVNLPAGASCSLQ
jgi:hypothetical protein